MSESSPINWRELAITAAVACVVVGVALSLPGVANAARNLINRSHT